ncbi:hypothetical protein [Rhodococcus ruber]|uniref:hypothetical protein n=1 Tax=Rhodococcus ruber TaxID=1830 RepID=UPI0037835CC7
MQTETRCPQHRRDAERRRGTSTQRGYGRDHRNMREAWRPMVEAGTVRCARCGRPIRPGQPWDLGHDDHDRSRYRGPEHQGCNRATAGRTR